MIDDNTLIARVVNFNDHQAFTLIVKRYQSQLRYSILQMNGWNEALSDDIAQETFISCYRSLKSFRQESKLNTWLYKIAFNHLQQYYRKNAKEYESHYDFDDETETLENDVVINSQQPLAVDEEVDNSRAHRQVAVILKKIPIQQRMVLHLTLHREYNSSEIAEMLDMPLGTVKSHIKRGKQFLREQLANSPF